MQYSDGSTIGTISFVLNGTTMCVAERRELWAKPCFGDAFAVHSIIDETTEDLPFYFVYVTDYRGNRYDFNCLSDASQEALLEFVVEEIF